MIGSLFDEVAAPVRPAPPQRATAEDTCRGFGLERSVRDGAGAICAKQAAQFANLILRGVSSDRPAMTPERWAAASRALPQYVAHCVYHPGDRRDDPARFLRLAERIVDAADSAS